MRWEEVEVSKPCHVSDFRVSDCICFIFPQICRKPVITSSLLQLRVVSKSSKPGSFRKVCETSTK